MDSKAWYQSKTILAAIGAVAAGLVQLIPALQAWIEQGHSIGGLITIVWPAAVVFFGVLAAIFRKGATTVIA